MKTILSLIVIFTLNSCIITAGFKPSLIHGNKLIEEKFPDNKKAIIIIKDQNSKLHTSSLWYRIDETFNGNYSNNYIWINRTKHHQILMVEPGVYALKKFGLYNSSHGSSWIEAKNSIYDKENNVPGLASFNIKSGEIVYLGDIGFSSYTIGKRKLWSNKQSALVRIKISEDLESAKTEFYSSYPKLSHYPITYRKIKINEKHQ